MRVFCYFVEPASYTLDLASIVYDRKNINYAFIKSVSLAEAPPTSLKIFLDKLSWNSKIRFLINTFRNNDLIIVNGYNNYPFILTFILNVFSFKKRYIAAESDTQLKIPKSILKRFIKKIYLNIIFRNKYVLGFAGGSKTHKELFRYYGMLEDRIFLMPMMVDNTKFYCDNKVFPKVFTFLYVGRLLDTKNVDILCERFINAFSEKNVELIIVGGGDNFFQFKKQYYNDKIQFKGSLFGENLIKLYHNSSVFVFPSSVEAWGLVINEAMSAALPIIAHKEVGSVYDFIYGKNTGFVIGNGEELEKKMLELYNNPDLCKEFSKNAESLMKEYWNYDLYESCLNDAITKVEQWR